MTRTVQINTHVPSIYVDVCVEDSLRSNDLFIDDVVALFSKTPEFSVGRQYARADFVDRLVYRRSVSMVARDHRKSMVGFLCSYQRPTSQDDKHLHLWIGAVDPAYRGKNIMANMIDITTMIWQLSGGNRLSANTPAQYAAMQRTLELCSFSQSARTPSGKHAYLKKLN
ncbi:MAG TPA: GNAT family N-acetyltransferase [Acidobacteriota bacterium]|nr:GNAT family N-acetyltransferase [Acidobacteriota bacterium]